MRWTETAHAFDPDPDRVPAPMQQHGSYGWACTAMGNRVQHWTAGPTRDPLGFAQVLLRRWPGFGDFALIARGPVWCETVGPAEARAATEALVAQLRRTCRGVIVTPDRIDGTDPMAGSGLLPMVTGGTQARLSLDGDSTARRARLHPKFRASLRQAERAQMDIVDGPLPPDPNHWLLVREAEQARRRGYRRLPPSFALAWRKANGAEATRLFTARIDGRAVAGMLFLRHGATASYHLGWTGEAGRRANAHQLLMWRANEWLAAAGHVWVELGTLDTVTTPGLARFKLATGASPVQTGSSWMAAPGTRPVAWLFGHRRGGPADVAALLAPVANPTEASPT